MTFEQKCPVMKSYWALCFFISPFFQCSWYFFENPISLNLVSKIGLSEFHRQWNYYLEWRFLIENWMSIYQQWYVWDIVVDHLGVKSLIVMFSMFWMNFDELPQAIFASNWTPLFSITNSIQIDSVVIKRHLKNWQMYCVWPRYIFQIRIHYTWCITILINGKLNTYL